MIPPKSDPRWKKIILEDEVYNFHALPTKMLMMRVKLLARDRTPQKIEEAIDVAHDFFSKNSKVVVQDIKLLFEKISEGSL
jgi:hypothetical protein